MSQQYSLPKGGASLILSFRLQNKTTLIVGSGALAASRAFAALEADSSVIILAKGGIESASDELQWRVRQKQVQFIDWEDLPSSSASNDEAIRLESFLKTTPNIALAVITDTLSGSERRNHTSAQAIYNVFRARNIPVNTTDMVDLCDFSFTSSHRFEHHETGEMTPLQIGVTTNGLGCRMAARLRREIVSKLPRDVGAAVEKVGHMRCIAKDGPEVSSKDISETTLENNVESQEVYEESAALTPDGPVSSRSDPVSELLKDVDAAVKEVGQVPSLANDGPKISSEGGSETLLEDEEICEESAVLTPNRPVPTRSNSETASEARLRRIKWVAQISEYWPISKLASMSDAEMQNLFSDSNPFSLDIAVNQLPASQAQSTSLHFPSFPKVGRILLVGSGPGHPSLLTIATHTALTQHADLVLSDKLVPAAVLSLIPKHVEVRIARKFPGNAEGAQIEMMEAAVAAAKQGLTVVRLKQGDPVVYGRAGEEVLYFRSHGFEPLVIPGVSSALAAPTFAGIPVTQRGVAESLIVCTGVGRKGKEVQLPGYERGRTVVILMGVARIQQVINALVDTSPSAADAHPSRRDGRAYPLNTPIAIIERASMPDQRVISSTLKDIVRALESSGEQRPPGMMIIGWAVLALHGQGDMGVLDEDGENKDAERVQRWLGGDSACGWKVREGLETGWEDL